MRHREYIHCKSGLADSLRGKNMGFMESYKYLDNLCKDMNGIGITGYIKDMEQEPNGDFYVGGWEKDYLQLKHYRHIRNQIAHENYANESDMCSVKDTSWLDEFYQRIIGQTDPLALCYKKTRFHSSQKFTEAKKNATVQYAPSPSKLSQLGNQLRPWSILLLIVIIFAVLIFFLLQWL